MTIRLVLIIFMTLLSACKDKEATHAGDKRGANKPGACDEAGGTLNKATNECECPVGHVAKNDKCVIDEAATAKQSCESSGGSWKADACKCPKDTTLKSKKCVGSSTASKKPKEACEAADGEWNKKDETCECPSGSKWQDNDCKSSESSSTFKESLKAACDKADGEYSKKDAICNCPDKKVLVKDVCKTLSGTLTETQCSSALSPGKWINDRCRCDDPEMTFSLPRGGCVEVGNTSLASREAMCVNSLNKGTWSEKEERCDCGSGKIWHQELCQDDSELSAREICESDFNTGRWDTAKKSCKCKVGYVWQANRCLALANVDEKLACESDMNKGKWDASLKTCICPEKKGWVKSVKQCAEGVQTAAQALCIQSGGNPGSVAGTCNCVSGLKVKVQQPQNFQYCVKDDKEEVPLWLLILLGLIAG